MELCSGKDLEVIQLHFPTKTKTIISQSCIPDHSSLWILKVELIYFPHSVCINSLRYVVVRGNPTICQNLNCQYTVFVFII